VCACISMCVLLHYSCIRRSDHPLHQLIVLSGVLLLLLLLLLLLPLLRRRRLTWRRLRRSDLDGRAASLGWVLGREALIIPRYGNGPFLSHLYIKVIFLPRQARDKHRESAQKRDRSLAAPDPTLRLEAPVTLRADRGWCYPRRC
jgi:hypothetical protein